MEIAFQSRGVEPEDFPGYAEAVARENLIRGAACLGLNEKICGLEVLPLTAFHYRRLIFMRSPFLIKGITPKKLCGTPEKKFTDGKPDILMDLMNFLWLVSPMYAESSVTTPQWSILKKLQFWKKQKRSKRDEFNTAFAPILKEPVDKVCAEILEYLDEAFVDQEEQISGSDKSYFAFEISIAQEFREHYGFRIDFWNPNCPRELNPLHVPLKLVFQFRKLRSKLNDPKAAVTNKSELFISLGLEKMGGDRARN